MVVAIDGLGDSPQDEKNRYTLQQLSANVRRITSAHLQFPALFVVKGVNKSNHPPLSAVRNVIRYERQRLSSRSFSSPLSKGSIVSKNNIPRNVLAPKETKHRRIDFVFQLAARELGRKFD